MKKLLFPLLALSLLSTIPLAQADIHDSPGMRQTPARKLGRGVSNLLFGFTEIPHRLCLSVDHDGSVAGVTSGLADGVTRMIARTGFGVYEVVTFPFPTTKGSYRPIHKLEDRSDSKGMTEFPNALMVNSKYDNSRFR